MADRDNIARIGAAIRAIQNVRSGISKTFCHLQEGVKALKEEESPKEVFLNRFREDILEVKNSIEDFETHSNSLMKLKEASTMGNVGQINQDPILDKTPIYAQVLQTYKWSTKLRDHAVQADMLLSKSAQRRHSGTNVFPSKRKKSMPTSHAIPAAQVDKLFDNYNRAAGITIRKEQSSPHVFQIMLERTIQAIVVLQSLLIERVIVRAHHEIIRNDDGSLDLWKESRYEVFRKISDHANSAMQQYYVPSSPDLSIRSFILWLNSYRNLFSIPCKRCGVILRDNLPPTWREYQTLQPIHENCRE